MKKYKIFLEQSGYKASTIEKFISTTKQYITWLQNKGLQMGNTTYKDILNYISHLQALNKNSNYINERINNLGKYYEYLKLPNITYKVRLQKRERKRILYLTEKELETIYTKYEPTIEENKQIVGLIIYQGLRRQELLKLTINSINFTKGEITIPSTEIKHGRILKLEPHQIIPLYKQVTHQKRFRKEILFNACVKQYKLKTCLTKIYIEIDKICLECGIKIKRISYLNQSRYCILIRKYGLRLGQYKCGFKSICTAEEYKIKDITNLQTSLLKYHPMP